MPPPEDNNLTWIVPGRRAVVKRRTSYWDLVHKWGENLLYYRRKIASWYALNDPAEGPPQQSQFLLGLGALTAFLHQINPSGEVDFDRTARGSQTGAAGNTLDVRPMRVRLWKGPLRVLLEQRDCQTAVEETVDQDVRVRTTRVTYNDQPLVLQLTSAQRVVYNYPALFLMGDVVEFPLARFLAACGKSDYNGITFNPDGSFFLGTSLSANGQPRAVDAEPFIHDNLVAMRFQHLLGLMRGSLYHFREVLAGGHQADDPDSDCVVHARGITYGATQHSPTSSLGEGYWAMRVNEWGYRNSARNFPANLPRPADLTRLRGDPNPPLTPGIACSPSSLTLASFMLNLTRWGRLSIQNEVTRYQSQEYGRSYERIDQEDLIGERNERVEARERLVRQIDDILAESTGQTLCSALSDADLGALSADARQAVESRRSAGDPAGAMQEINARTGQAEGQDEPQALARLHQGLCNAFARIRRDVDILRDSTDWDPARAERPVLDMSEWPSGTHGSSGCTDSHGISAERLSALRSELEALKVRLEEGLTWRDLSEVFRDLNVIEQGNHEISAVKVYPYDNLMGRTGLPLSHQIGAYDPLSGEDQFPADGRVDDGHLYLFECGASLVTWDRSLTEKLQVCGISKFNWQRFNANMLYSWQGSESRQWGLEAPTRRGRGWEDNRRFDRCYRLVENDVLHRIYPRHNDQNDAPSPADPVFKRYAILALTAGETKRFGNPLGDVNEMVADRALPFPTFQKALDEGNFPRKNDILPYYQRAYDAAQEFLTSSPTSPDAPKVRSYQSAVRPGIALASGP